MSVVCSLHLLGGKIKVGKEGELVFWVAGLLSCHYSPQSSITHVSIILMRCTWSINRATLQCSQTKAAFSIIPRISGREAS